MPAPDFGIHKLAVTLDKHDTVQQVILPVGKKGLLVINLNINVTQEVVYRLDGEAKTLIQQNPDIF